MDASTLSSNEIKNSFIIMKEFYLPPTVQYLVAVAIIFGGMKICVNRVDTNGIFSDCSLQHPLNSYEEKVFSSSTLILMSM